MRNLTGWLISYFCRWLPARTPAGLQPVGTPDRDSPVIVTANFWLTVRRVRRALRGENVWLLVANTRGINVWCAATGGMFTHHQVIDSVKLSGLTDIVDHRNLLLPALAAPGVNAQAVREATGFTPGFGPVRAEDLHTFLTGGGISDSQRLFRFDLRHRADMFIPMNLPVFIPIAALVGIFAPAALSLFALLFWSSIAFLYLFIDVIPGKSGWAQAAVSAGMWAVGWAAVDWIAQGNPLAHWPWLIALFGIFLLAGIDLAGTASPRRSDFEMLLHRLRRRPDEGGRGVVMTERSLGQVEFDAEACIGCGRCREVCPIGVFGPPAADGRTTLARAKSCFSCGACVAQCPSGALCLET